VLEGDRDGRAPALVAGGGGIGDGGAVAGGRAWDHRAQPAAEDPPGDIDAVGVEQRGDGDLVPGFEGAAELGGGSREGRAGAETACLGE
jgi:hypothetical protein